jgi:hypothetical protein
VHVGQRDDIAGDELDVGMKKPLIGDPPDDVANFDEVTGAITPRQPHHDPGHRVSDKTRRGERDDGAQEHPEHAEDLRAQIRIDRQKHDEGEQPNESDQRRRDLAPVRHAVAFGTGMPDDDPGGDQEDGGSSERDGRGEPRDEGVENRIKHWPPPVRPTARPASSSIPQAGRLPKDRFCQGSPAARRWSIGKR